MIDDIILWLKNQAQIRNSSTFLIELDNSISSIVNVLLAKKTGLAVHAIINYDMTNWNLNRDFCESINLDFTRVSYETDLEDFMPEIDEYQDKRILYKNNENLSINVQNTARVTYISETTNSLVLSNITRNDYLFFRNYSKLNAWDLIPFANLSASNVNSLLNNLTDSSRYVLNYNTLKEINNIINIAYKPNLEIEWLFDANERSKPIPIIESELDPTKHSKWFTYTIQQKTLIAKAHQIEKLTRYKQINLPCFKQDDNN